MNIFEQQMKEGGIYKKLKKRKVRLEFAKEGIYEMLKISPKSYISLSFGKQSTCLAHMIYKINPDIPCYFLASAESWSMHNFKEVIEAFLKICPIKLMIVQTDHFFRNDLKTWKENRDVGQFDLQKMCNRNDWSGWFWGLVKEESKERKITLCKQWEGQPHPTIFRYVDNKYRCCPLMNWDILDIAAYIEENNLPLLNIYKKLGLQMRTTARATKTAVLQGTMIYLKMIDIEGFNKMCKKFGELGNLT